LILSRVLFDIMDRSVTQRSQDSGYQEPPEMPTSITLPFAPPEQETRGPYNSIAFGWHHSVHNSAYAGYEVPELETGLRSGMDKIDRYPYSHDDSAYSSNFITDVEPQPMVDDLDLYLHNGSAYSSNFITDVEPQPMVDDLDLYLHNDRAYSSHVSSAYSSHHTMDDEYHDISDLHRYVFDDSAYSSHVASANSRFPMEPRNGPQYQMDKVESYNHVYADSTYSSYAPPEPDTGLQNNMQKFDNPGYRHVDIGYSSNARSGPETSQQNTISRNRISIQNILNVESSVPSADPQIMHVELHSNPSRSFKPLAAHDVARDSFSEIFP
jgi:hypothetical protein